MAWVRTVTPTNIDLTASYKALKGVLMSTFNSQPALNVGRIQYDLKHGGIARLLATAISTFSAPLPCAVQVECRKEQTHAYEPTQGRMSSLPKHNKPSAMMLIKCQYYLQVKQIHPILPSQLIPYVLSGFHHPFEDRRCA